jgi:SAM-dependent methyltransferase
MQKLRKKHQVLLDDSVRVRAYERALKTIVQPGDIVADLGCGLGILSFIAARAGAARIHAVEVEPRTLALAREEAKLAGLEERVVFHEGLVQNIDIPERVDVVVTETMGSLGLDENIVPLILDAKKYWLKDGGTICPCRIAIALVPIDATINYRGAVVVIDSVEEACFLATPYESDPLDLMSTTEQDFVVRPRFTMTRSGLLSGFAGWFTVWLTEKISFSSAPHCTDTHWHQRLLPLREPIAVKEGQQLDVILGIGPDDSGLQSIVEYDFTLS